MNTFNPRHILRKILSVPIHIKIIGILFAAVIVLELATIVSLYIIFSGREYSRIVKTGNAAGKIIAYRIKGYLKEGDTLKLKKMLRYNISISPILMYIVVRTNGGRIIASASKKGVSEAAPKYGFLRLRGGGKPSGAFIKSPYGHIINLSFPVIEGKGGGLNAAGTKIGTVAIGLLFDSFHYFFKITVTFIIFVLFPLIIFTVIFFRWISLSVLKPLSDLSTAAYSAKNGDYGIVVPTPDLADKKLAGLITGFNDMLAAFNKAEYKWETKDLRRKEFLAEIIAAQESERKKLSRELHDELEQFLIYINMKFGILQKLDSAALRNECIKEMRQGILEQLDIIKNITKELRPGLVYELGLYKALMQYAEEIKSNHNIQVEIYAAGMKEFKAGEDIEIGIYRIL